MNSQSTSSKGRLGRTPQAVILYDRLEMLLVANQILGWLPPSAGFASDWRVNSWRFDMLQKGTEGERALGETREAEVMVVAIGNLQTQPDWPENWLPLWMARQKPARTLLMLLLGVDRRLHRIQVLPFCDGAPARENRSPECLRS